ncbi:MAG TPA: pentapeptide repeat-containing protein [Candidatus Saccharimonadia bacterium]|nr:pentapeptide repeat-containing protein [Candidatus Saccharimonadia bacterium]
MKVDPPKLPQIIPDASPGVLVAAMTIEGVQVTRVNWGRQEGKRASFDAMRFVEPDMTSAKLREGGWADVAVDGGLLAGTDLTGSTLRRVTLGRARASGLIVAETEAKEIQITGCKLDLSNFRFSKWSHVLFSGCDLTDADFAGASFRDVSFQDCDLVGCDFSGAHLTRVDLRTSRLDNPKGVAGLKGAQITSGQLMQLSPVLAHAMGIEVNDS